MPLEGSKGCEAPCPDEAETYGFLQGLQEDSDIPTSCEMKDKPAFKPLQGNPTLFLVRESRYPLPLRQVTQGPSHIPIAEGRLLFMYLWKIGLPVP